MMKAQNFEMIKFQYEKENLNNVFGLELDYFDTVRTKTITGQTINLFQLLMKIRYNLVYEITPEVLLTPKYINGIKNPVYDNLKMTLPSICYNATFHDTKQIKNCRTINNIMFLEIDDFPCKEEALNYKESITNQYNWIIACYLSLSRLGVHIIISVDQIRDNNDFNLKYDFINNKYFNNMLDKNAKSLTRFTIIPHDFEVIINEDPEILCIDTIFKEYEKGINGGKKEKNIIYTPYTFSDNLNTTLNIAVRDNKLFLRTPIDESKFKNPNLPLHYPDGKDYVEINLFPYKHRKISDGRRTNTLGRIAMQLIYLNGSPSNRETIFRFLCIVNNRYCFNPLPFKELQDSFNHNWDKYTKGELNFSSCIKKKHIFWSIYCTLTANEKRRITARINASSGRKKNQRSIEDAIEDLFSEGIKITQIKVAKKSGLSLPTVKNYWKSIKTMVKEYNNNI